MLINIDKKDFLLNVIVIIPNDTKINELIKLAVLKFNEEKFMLKHNEKSQYYVLLRERFMDYQLKPSKKNNYPNFDFPPFCHYISIYEASTQKFSLIFKQNDLILIKAANKECGQCNQFQLCALL